MNYTLKLLVLLFLATGSFTFSVGKENVSGNGFSRFAISDGLSNNLVTVIFQDSHGFLWIGTEDGLNRYDGYTFKTFRHNPSDVSSISGNHIQTIVQDNQYNLWIGTRNSGLSKLDYSTGKFTTYLSDSDSEESLPENNVYGLLVDNKGRLWVKTRSYLSLFKGDRLGFENYGHYSNIFNVTGATKYPLLQASDSSLLLGTKGGLCSFDFYTKHFSSFTCDSDSGGFLCKDAVFDIMPYADQKFLVATSSGLEMMIFEEFNTGTTPSIGTEIIAQGTVNDILKADDGSFFVGTNKGLDVFDNDNKNSHEFSLDGKTLGSFQVTSLLEDKSGIIWVGTRFNGLFKLNLTPPKFKTITKDSRGVPDFGSFNFQSVFQDVKGNLWLGTRDAGIYRYHPPSGDIEHYEPGHEKFGKAVNACFVLHKGDSSKLWAGTNSGLYYYSPELNRFVEYEHSTDSGVSNLLRKNKVYALANDYEGNLWVGTRFGLYRTDGEDVFSYFQDSNEHSGLYSDQINALCTDEEGNLWIGTSSGLNLWDRKLKKILRINFNGDSHTVKPPTVISLNLAYNGRIRVGTASGLWEIASKKARPVLMPGNSNLDNDMIKAVASDAASRAWVSTNKGMACVNPDGTVYNFDSVDGLPGYVFNQNSFFKNRQGTMFFGSTEGLCWFHPDSINYNSVRPPLAFTEIQVSRRGESLRSLWSLRDSLEIKYRPFINLSFNFSALEFTQPYRNRYRVFLQGYDHDWRSVTADNEVSFSNLLPGKYKLKVIGSNNDFTWNNDPLELDIVVIPPLWMSNYAFAFYLLALIFVIHLFINYRVRHYRKANKALQEKTVNKNQIEAQREVLTRVNRSLTDSINYARRIQSAMIPSETSFFNIFPESFVYLRARDIVSGDFYWFHEKGDKIFVTAVDCTGHGVPGAFMSIIGIDLLKNIVEIQGIESPSEILKAMNDELVRTLHREQFPSLVDEDVKDGMDMALIVIDRKKKKLEFAGAYNGFYLLRDNDIYGYKGNRFPVGYLKDGKSPVFELKEISLQANDVIYLFSDGLADQFGGVDQKKFKYRRFRLLLLNIHQLAFHDQKSILHQKIEEWMDGTNEQVDDILVMGFKPLG